MPINADKEIKAIRLDLINKDEKNKICFITEVTVPSEIYMSIKEVEQLPKYKDLKIEVTKIWKIKSSAVLIVIEALGFIKKGLVKQINKH